MVQCSITLADALSVGTLGDVKYRESKKDKRKSWAFAFSRINQSQRHSWSYRLDTSTEIIARLITFSREKIKPLFSDPRRQQLLDISGEEDEVEINEAEKKANRYLAVSATSLAFTTAGGVFYSPLSLLAVPCLTYVVWGVVQRSYRHVVEDGMIAMPLNDVLFDVGLLITGHHFSLSFIACFYYFSQKLLAKTEKQGRKKLINVFDIASSFISILSDGVEQQISLDALQIGDTVVVYAGQMIPVDGIISDGYASIDQRILTGESQPAEKGPDDQVLASTVVLKGKIYVQTEKTGASTIAAQIGEILSSTADFKTSHQSRGEKMCNQGSWPTLALSALALRLLGTASAIAALNVGFGYHMRIIAPLSVLNYLSIASWKGTLIKDGRSMEVLSQVDTIVFDKTGTLTEEVPTVGKIYVNNHNDLLTLKAGTQKKENNLLALAAATEYKQTHPIALAIRREARRRELTLPPIGEASVEVGYGIKVQVGEQWIRLGSRRFMQLEGILIPDEYEQIEQDRQEQGYSFVYIAQNARLSGAIELCPTIRPEAKEVIRELRKRKMSMVIISGDHEKPTKKLAQEVGIKQYFAQTLPENKASLVEALQKNGKSVCFVGDGINDSIALAEADVSISLRGASTIATDTASIILMDQSLKQLPELFDIAHQFESNMKTSLMISTIPSFFSAAAIFFLHSGVFSTILLYDLGLLLGILNVMSPLIKSRRS